MENDKIFGLDVDSLKTILSFTNEIELNANDFFDYATACSVFVDIYDLIKYNDVIKKYGNSGIHAIMAHQEKAKPIKEYLTKDYLNAFNELIKIDNLKK